LEKSQDEAAYNLDAMTDRQGLFFLGCLLSSNIKASTEKSSSHFFCDENGVPSS
jgi:hypothetical protein